MLNLIGYAGMHGDSSNKKGNGRNVVSIENYGKLGFKTTPTMAIESAPCMQNQESKGCCNTKLSWLRKRQWNLRPYHWPFSQACHYPSWKSSLSQLHEGLEWSRTQRSFLHVWHFSGMFGRERADLSPGHAENLARICKGCAVPTRAVPSPGYHLSPIDDPNIVKSAFLPSSLEATKKLGQTSRQTAKDSYWGLYIQLELFEKEMSHQAM